MGKKYEFFPDDVKSKLPPLYSQDESEDPIVHVKFFCPWDKWTWFATEGEEQNGDFMFFGYVIGDEREWGDFSLCELQSVKGPLGLKIERDIHFTPKRKSQIKEMA